MAIFSIDKINYVVTGSSEKLINVRLKNTETSEINRNFTFFTDEGVDAEANYATQVTDFSAVYKTHRIWKLFRATNEEKAFVSSYNKLLQDNSITSALPIVTDCLVDDYTQVYALFDAKDIIYKSAYRRKIARVDKEANDAKIDDVDTYIDVYSPRLTTDFIGFVQFSYFDSLGITEPYTYEPYMQYTTLRDDRQFRLSNDSGKMIWHYLLNMQDAQTFTYTPLSDLRKNSVNFGQGDYDPKSVIYEPHSYYEWLLSYEDLSADRLSTLFEPRFNLSGIPRNYISRFSMTLDMYNDFNQGVVMGDFIYGKNPYNAEYSMHMSREYDRATLSGVRKYNGIGVMGGKPFLKYYDDNLYIPDKGRSMPGSKDPRLLPDFPYSTIEADEITEKRKEEGYDLTIQDVPMKTIGSGGQIRKYQDVEIFDSMNRGLNAAKHKSNLYSVTIKNLRLNEQSDEDLKKIIKQDIKNTVRKICENLQPAHTQLFNVFIDNMNSHHAYVKPDLDTEEKLRLEFDSEGGN